MALNSELPAGCERAPVFEHAPSSPTCLMLRDLPLNLYIVLNNPSVELASLTILKIGSPLKVLNVTIAGS